MTTYITELVFFAFYFAVGFYIAWSYRSHRCRRALAALRELHKRNVAEAHQRGVRDGICAQMEAETANAKHNQLTK